MHSLRSKRSCGLHNIPPRAVGTAQYQGLFPGRECLHTVADAVENLILVDVHPDFADNEESCGLVVVHSLVAIRGPELNIVPAFSKLDPVVFAHLEVDVRSRG